MPNNYLQHSIGIESVAPVCMNKNTNIFSGIKCKVRYCKLHNYFAIIFLIIFTAASASNHIYNHSYNIDNNNNIGTILNCHSGHKLYIKSNINHINKMINGNTNSDKNLKIMQYNIGNSNFENSIHKLQHIIQNHQPDIMCISEANISNKYDFNINNFLGYNIILNKQYNIIGVSRNCILIKDRIKYSRRWDLENDITCEIWLQVASVHKRILVCGSYSQWSLLKCMGVKNSNNIKLQEERFKITLKG